RFGGERLVHGGLIPQFIWITEDGEIRVAGQQLGKGLAASLRDEKIAAEIGRYFAPEAQHSGEASKSTEVYALGAILYLLITGHEPPDATRTSAFTHAVRATKTMAGTPMPDDIRAILEKSLNIDPAGRFASPGDMHAALSALSANGKYTATSFNLAFYLTTLLKKEMEAEAAERERESKINVAAYAAEPDEPSAAVPAAAATAIERKRSKVPVAVAATLLIAVAGAGAWFVLGSKQQDAHAASAVQAASALPVPVQKAPVPIPEPIVASPEPAEPAAAEPVEPVTQSQAAVDEAAQKKAFDDAVKRRLQQELLKLQAEYTRQLQAQQARNAPVLSTQAPQTIAETAERPAVSASELDLRRREIARAEDMTASLAQQTVTTAPPQTASVAPPAATTATTATVPPAATQTVPPPVAARATREGDVVDMSELDQLPTPVREPRPMYPPIAARQRIEATIMASLLISETGDVLEVKILRGEQRFGFNDAAIRAFRSARYTSPMKDGKRVRTWVAQMIQFKP
ncbi:MAG TPA: TonB family protein, partial [Thermoanaerobaculia bacterium]|nr:TonB family protein [Thermoanaerobaculia bacterium]